MSAGRVVVLRDGVSPSLLFTERPVPLTLRFQTALSKQSSHIAQECSGCNFAEWKRRYRQALLRLGLCHVRDPLWQAGRTCRGVRSSMAAADPKRGT